MGTQSNKMGRPSLLLVWSCLFSSLFPLAMLGAVLMDSSNSSSFVMFFFPIMVLAVHFAYRFDKKMRSYLPPERYETFDHIPVYRLRILLDILLIVWAIGGTLLLYYIVFSFNLNGWLYNLLFHQI